MAAGKVTFSYKDYARGQRQRTMTLDAVEFLRRFLLHVLPRGFTRIRSFGFLANRCRATKLERCRFLLGQMPAEWEAEVRAESSQIEKIRPCPNCETGCMVTIRRLSAGEVIARQRMTPRGIDSS